MLSFVEGILVYLRNDDRRAWLVLLVASVAGGICRSLFLATVNAAVLAIGEGRSSAIYFLLPVLLLVITLGTDMFAAVRGRMVADRLAMRMRSDLARAIGKTNLRFIERQSIHNLHYHMWITVGIVADTYFMLLGFVGGVVTLAFNGIYIAWLSPVGLLVAVVVATAAVLTDLIFERANVARRHKLDDLRRQSHGAHFDLLHGFKELRLSDAKSEDIHRCIAELERQIYQTGNRVTQVTASGTAATNFFTYLAMAIFGIGFSVLAEIPPVTIMQLITAVLFTIAPLSNIVGAFPGFGRARVALENLERLNRSIDQIREPSRPAAKSRLHAFESIALRDVVFRFDDGPNSAQGADGFVLGPVNLTIERGDVVCVVGGNGSGKTVLMRIVAGLYPAASGELLFNGKAVASEDMEDYRNHFTTVFNDFFLFRDLLANRDASPAIVTRWLNYYDIGSKTTFAGGSFSTVELSVGQRKRLALVVALLDDRPVLLLDEFGAEQDPEHRDQFYRVWLPELRKMGMTILIVSHDDRYFECSDVLVRMDYGRIVECRRLESFQGAPHARAAGSPAL